MPLKYIMAEAKYLTEYRPDSSELVLVDPVDFITATTDPQFFTNNRLSFGSEESVQKLIKRLENGQEIDPAYVDIDIGRGYRGKVVQHEGRHRAIACIELGIKEMPVIYFYRRIVNNKDAAYGFEIRHIPLNKVPPGARARPLNKYEAQWIK